MAGHIKLQERHRPTEINTRFHGAQIGFSDYVATTRQILDKFYSTIGSVNIEHRIYGNAPFELEPSESFRINRGKPYQRGILLTHGLTDSPYFMRPLAQLFRDQGWRVMAILLPGHGTQPGDMLEVEWLDWVKTVKYGIEQLNKEVEQLYLGGLSAGATLSLLHSLGNDQIRGLFLFSPALAITPWAAWASMHKLYSWLLPSAKWVNIMPDKDEFKYESFPKNAAYQMHGLINQCQVRLHDTALNIPVFIAASEDDATVKSSATLDLMAKAYHPKSKMIYYVQNIPLESTRTSDPRIMYTTSFLPEQRILSFSHTSIVLPPEDSHYGLHGNYSNCLHYYPHEMENYAVCNQNTNLVLQGEITAENLSRGIMRRLMYNPFFPQLVASIQDFISDAL